MIDIKKNILMKNYTTFRIGGPAKFFAEVNSEEELIGALRYAKENGLEFFILGGGSNLLVSDKGYGGLIIKMKLNSVRIIDNIMKAEAGAPLSKIVRDSAANGLAGIEWAINIPGTIGGATIINAGCFGSEMSELVNNVKVLNTDDLKIETYPAKKCGFSYRSSVFKSSKNKIVLAVSLKFKKGGYKEIDKKIKEIIGKRAEQQPRGMSAGSFFKKVAINDDKIMKMFEDSGGVKFEDNKISAGWLIDQAELKGKKIGGAMVSEKHANFIVNTGNATAEDVIMLVSIIKQQVRDKFGIELVEEVQYLGF